MARSKLSSQPSKLVLQAIEDVKATQILAKKTGKLRLDMHTYLSIDPFDLWYQTTERVCTLCAAGAAAMHRVPKVTKLVESGKLTLGSQSFFKMLTKEETGKVYAIDQFRQGEIVEGLREMAEVLPKGSKWQLKIAKLLRKIEDKEADDDFKTVYAVPVADYDPANTRPWFNGMRKVARYLEKIGL